MRKNYVLDTNILLSEPNSIKGFADNVVWITGTTLQELDSKKRLNDEIGYNAREVIRYLDNLRENNLFAEEICLGNGGALKFEADGVNPKNIPKGYNLDNPDNRIISSCVHIESQISEKVILVTNDVSMRVNASVCGIQTQGYLNEEVEDYTGHSDFETDDYSVIDEIYKNKKIIAPNGRFYENEFVTIHSGTSSALSVYRNKELHLVTPPSIFGVRPLNSAQTYALWALSQSAEDIPMVILKGPAGTSKTFLSIAAGLDKTISQKHFKNEYRKLLISRPNTIAGDEGFGYLPGDLNEKMTPLLLPYYDNLENLLSKDEEDADAVQEQIDDLFSSGTIDICALSYIRGRSLNNSFLICDEAQNASRQLIKDVITRCGQQSKIVLAGDPDQCDNPKLSKRTNGLVYATECFKNSKLAAIITFENKHSVRSALAKEAISLLK